MACAESERNVVAPAALRAGGGTLGGQQTPGGDLAPVAVPRPPLAWTPEGSSEGEDEFDAFPLPEEARGEELAVVIAAAGDGPQAHPVELPSLPPSAEAAIRRFHQEIGLLPRDEPLAESAPPALTPEVVPDPAPLAASPPGGGGGDDGRDPPVAAGGAGGGGRRRRPREIVDTPMTVFEHLDELRRRIMWAGIAFVVGLGAVLPFYTPIIHFLMRGYPAQSLAPMGEIYAIMEVTILGGLVLSSPILIYQAIAYVLPAMTAQERRILSSYLPGAMTLFVVGCSFSLFVFQPLLLRFAKLIPGVHYDPNLSEAINFAVAFTFPLGLLFELPIVITVLVYIGILSPTLLRKNRRWAVMAIVILAEAFTPPFDVIVTPTIIFVPLYALYELSIVLATRVERAKQRRALDSGS